MISLLKNQYVRYLNSRKAHLTPFDGTTLILKTEVTSDMYFDIMDKLATICQPIGKGSATYNNTQSKEITFIDYEDFINQLPLELQKGIKRCDFIAYDTNSLSFFILNELSQSSTSKGKMNDARQQLHNTAFNLCEAIDVKRFIDTFEVKKCVFSNKNRLISTPNNIADAFSKIQDYLPDPIKLNYHPITKLGFELIETAIIEV